MILLLSVVLTPLLYWANGFSIFYMSLSVIGLVNVVYYIRTINRSYQMIDYKKMLFMLIYFVYTLAILFELVFFIDTLDTKYSFQDIYNFLLLATVWVAYGEEQRSLNAYFRSKPKLVLSGGLLLGLSVLFFLPSFDWLGAVQYSVVLALLGYFTVRTRRFRSK